MGVEVARHEPGVDLEESGIMARELDAVHATEERLCLMRCYGESIDWLGQPEDDGWHIGRIYDIADQEEVGIVIVDPARELVCVTSHEAALNEQSAKDTQAYVRAFTSPLAIDSILWRAPTSATSANRTGQGLIAAAIGTPEHRAVLTAISTWRHGQVESINPPSDWLLFTMAEWGAFLDGAKADEFDFDESGRFEVEPQLTRRQLAHQMASSQAKMLSFHRRLVAKDGYLTLPVNGALIDRWVDRHKADRAHFSQHTKYVLDDYFAHFVEQEPLVDIQEALFTAAPGLPPDSLAILRYLRRRDGIDK